MEDQNKGCDDFIDFTFLQIVKIAINTQNTMTLPKIKLTRLTHLSFLPKEEENFLFLRKTRVPIIVFHKTKQTQFVISQAKQKTHRVPQQSKHGYFKVYQIRFTYHKNENTKKTKKG